ncbi:ankyrin repeat domain-containing protein [Lichenicola cladoniae]|uniref:Ankyrin repeat domain-containing protein n=1 Tax=Lichenicola cladoniae TaxID=1484109 RepID=A0A6M8HTI9_9PROT|nr:ankyrin repeat domain-containing protein [Lichenicola cladoniae]NPD68242.1 ankyrin repeat domain-containing protein [Acetobacteraceae bacterium]QKE91844.1 ankyrin repeat domain-containing protein [Lichenicola cladoniae]
MPDPQTDTHPVPAPPLGFTHEQIEALYFNAAREGQDDLLAQFLDAGADPNRIDGKGYTPLILASYNGHAAATELLLARGGDPKLRDGKGNTALSGVAFKGDIPIARLLLEAGAAIDAPNHVGRTPLMFAVMFGREAMVNFLLGQGADPTIHDGEGTTAIILAERQGSVTLAQRMSTRR